MKDKNNISIDEQIKSAFEGAKMDPPAGVWEAVSGQIGTQVVSGVVKSTVFKTVAAKIVAVAVIGASVSTGYFLLKDNKSLQLPENKSSEKIQEGLVDSDVVPLNDGINETNQKDQTIDYPLSSNENEKNTTAHSQRTVKEVKTNGDADKNVVSSDKPIQPSISVTVQNNSSIALYQPDSIFCPGETISYNLRSQTVFDRVLWVHTGAILQHSDAFGVQLRYSKEGFYEVKAICFSGQTQIQVSRKLWIKMPVISLMSKKENGQIVISAGGDKFKQYSWSINGDVNEGNKSSLSYINSADYPGVEKVSVNVTGYKNQFCEVVGQMVVDLPKPATEPFIPNVFTPTEKDGKNDCFSVEIDQPEFYYMLIKSRNGKVVFESHDPLECWNGKVLNTGADCMPDAYFYQFVYKLKDGEKVSKNGRLQLF